MTKAETPDQIALRAQIFQRLGLGPNGMCATGLSFRAREARMDEASRSIMSAEEREACAVHGVAPHDYIVTRGTVNGTGERTVFTAQPAGESGDDDTMIEMARESLSKFCAGVGGRKNRDHLFAAQAAINRMLKRS